MEGKQQLNQFIDAHRATVDLRGQVPNVYPRMFLQLQNIVLNAFDIAQHALVCAQCGDDRQGADKRPNGAAERLGAIHHCQSIGNRCLAAKGP